MNWLNLIFGNTKVLATITIIIFFIVSIIAIKIGYSELRHKIDVRDKKIIELNRKIATLNSTIESLKSVINDKNVEILELRKRYDDLMDEYNNIVKNKNKTIEELKKILNKQKSELINAHKLKNVDIDISGDENDTLLEKIREIGK